MKVNIYELRGFVGNKLLGGYVCIIQHQPIPKIGEQILYKGTFYKVSQIVHIVDDPTINLMVTLV